MVCDDDDNVGAAGELITVMAEVAVPVQPLISDPVTVYVVVVVGDASNVYPVVASSPVEGVQV